MRGVFVMSNTPRLVILRSVCKERNLGIATKQYLGTYTVIMNDLLCLYKAIISRPSRARKFIILNAKTFRYFNLKFEVKLTPTLGLKSSTN